MKKILALILCVLMLTGLTACGKDSADLSSALGDAVKGAADKNADPAEPEAPSPGTEEPVQTEAPPVEDDPRALVETGFISLRYHEEDGWVTVEETDISSNDNSSKIILSVLNSEEKIVYRVTVSAAKENAEGYRDSLYDDGFDHYELVVNNAYPTVNIGGLEFYHMDGFTGYYCRDVGAGVTVKIQCYADWDHSVDDEIVTRLIEGLSFHLTDVGNVDFPWYWEGTPFSGTTLESMVGTASLTARWLPMDPCLPSFEIFDHDVAVSGNTVYILSGSTLRSYEYDGSTLRFLEETDLVDEYTGVDVLSDGTLTLSGFMRDFEGYKDGAKVFSYDGPDNFAPAPDGTWGVSFFAGNTVKLFRFSGGAASSEERTLAELSNISHVRVDGSYIYVNGSAAETKKHTVFVYDHGFNLQYTLLGEDGSLGSMTFVTKTPNGFLGLDGNMREVVLWNSDGAFMGSFDDYELFGTGYPWFCSAEYMPDGTLLVIMTDERDDLSCLEVLAFALTGF